MDTILILTNPDCPPCRLVKGDGGVGVNPTRDDGSWWTQSTFRDAIVHDGDVRFRCFEIAYKSIWGKFTVVDLARFAWSDTAGEVQRHRLDHNDPMDISAIVPRGIERYFYAWPCVMFIDGGLYDRAVGGGAVGGGAVGGGAVGGGAVGGGAVEMAHPLGFNLNRDVNGVYTTARELARVYAEIQPDIPGYAAKVVAGEVSLALAPEYISL